MKKFTLLLAATMMAASAWAAPTFTKGPKAPLYPTVKKEMRADAKLGNKVMEANRTLDVQRLQALQSGKMMSRAESDVIRDVEGRVQTYTQGILGYISFFGQIFFEPSEAMADIVWGEDGAVYFKNIINLGVDYYIKGQYADGKITIDFPQNVYYMYDEDYDEEIDLSLNVLKFAEDLEAVEYVDELYTNCEPTTVVAEVAEDGTVHIKMNEDYSYDTYLEEGEFPEYIIGLVGDTTPGTADWWAYGDCEYTYTEFNMELVTLPEGAVAEDWTLKYYDVYGDLCALYAKVAVVGDDLYIGALNEDFMEGWAKGKIEGDKVHFENGQYLGYLDLYSLPIFFITAKITQEYDEVADDWYAQITINPDGMIFDYDAEAKVLASIDEEDCFILNGKLEEIYYLEIYNYPTFYVQSEEELCAAPLDPSVYDFKDFDPEFYGGQGAIIWDIPFFNVNDAILNTEDMYYNFIVDGEVYPLDPEEYPEVEEYMEDIPYNYTEGWDIGVTGSLHTIYYYVDGAETFGCQSFYKAPNGKTYASQLVVYDPVTGETSSIESVAAPVEVVSTKYYDMTGRQVTNPQAGIYVKSMKLSDGKVRNIKVAIK